MAANSRRPESHIVGFVCSVVFVGLLALSHCCAAITLQRSMHGTCELFKRSSVVCSGLLDRGSGMCSLLCVWGRDCSGCVTQFVCVGCLYLQQYPFFSLWGFFTLCLAAFALMYWCTIWNKSSTYGVSLRGFYHSFLLSLMKWNSIALYCHWHV